MLSPVINPFHIPSLSTHFFLMFLVFYVVVFCTIPSCELNFNYVGFFYMYLYLNQTKGSISVCNKNFHIFFDIMQKCKFTFKQYITNKRPMKFQDLIENKNICSFKKWVNDMIIRQVCTARFLQVLQICRKSLLFHRQIFHVKQLQFYHQLLYHKLLEYKRKKILNRRLRFC